MLAGNNVKVEYSGDTLTFVGDSSDNWILVQRVDSTHLKVSGKRIGDPGYNTRLNNNSYVLTIPFDGTKNSLRFDLGAGIDYVRLDTNTGVRLRTKYLDVKMGSGNDYVNLYHTYVYYSTNIDTDTGNDRLIMRDVQLGTEIGYYGGVYHSYGTTSIKMGTGKDIVDLQDVLALHNVTIDTARAGVDTFADTVTLVDFQCGYDNYHHDQATLKVTTGGGADSIAFTRVQSDFILVDAKAGSDTVNFTSVLFDNDGSKVNLGSGFDRLRRKSNGGDGLGDVTWVSYEATFT